MNPRPCKVIYSNEDLRVVERQNYTDDEGNKYIYGYARSWAEPQYSYFIEYRLIDAMGDEAWVPSGLPKQVINGVAKVLRGDKDE